VLIETRQAGIAIAGHRMARQILPFVRSHTNASSGKNTDDDDE
jgi:hypothetical protein